MVQRMIRRERRALRPAVVLVLAGVVVLALSSLGRAGPEFPLDEYPGFGRSPDAALRDDTIAYWEAYQRELIVKACMSLAGFEYAPNVAFPHAEILIIAEGLGVDWASPAHEQQRSPGKGNRAYVSQLTQADRDRYFQALFNESAAAIEEADRTGVVSSSRGESFATGGCFGEAQAALPGIWQARHMLEEALEEMRRDIASSPQMSVVTEHYADCTHDAGGVRLEGPWAVDEALATIELEGEGAFERSVLDRVAEACAGVWASGYRQVEVEAAHRFVTRNHAVLQEAAERYAGSVDAIADDADFVEYLAAHAALAHQVLDEDAAPAVLDPAP